MVPPEAPQAVSIGFRNCHAARFGRPLKAPKPLQQLSKAFEPQNPPERLATTTTQRKTVTERTIATTTTQRKRNRQTHSNIQHWNALATV